MIVLDTNVVSELMRDSPQQAVRAWFRAQSASSLFVTTVTEAEILTGIALLPDGRRRRSLERVIHDLYQARHETIIYDDDYGVWTEWDQNSVAAEVFDLIDKTEN